LIQYSNLFSTDALTNETIGNSEKFLSRQDTLALAAKPLILNDIKERYVNRPIILLPIAQGFKKRKDYKEALIRAWKVSSGINGWSKCDENIYEGNRYEIIPKSEPTDVLLYKDFRNILEPVFGYWKRGTGGGGIILKVEQNGRIVFIRGQGKEFKDDIYYI
jgi:hypothetical protein